ncbi:MAG: hypothetical protein PVJ57_06020 [Phycisphaerae bacterium]|jgi:hypothetical protein
MAHSGRADGDDIPSLFGRDILRLGRRRREQCLQEACAYWRRAGFPYPRLTRSEIEPHFRALADTPLCTLRDGDTLGPSTVGLRLANSYHPQMWHARSHRHRRSPYTYFHEDDHLRAMLERAPRFWPNARCWSAQAVRNLIRVYSGGRVANFRPVVARNILAAYSADGDTVLDFSAGYGGRLLACCTLRRHCVAIDPARRQVFGLRAMWRDLRAHSPGQVEIVQGCAEDVLTGVGRGSVDLVFSSPPYYNLEIYSDEATQSSSRYRTYDEWRARFLDVVVTQSRRVLRRGGYFIINVSTRGRHALADDTLAIASRLFRHEATLHIAMPCRPLQRSQNGGACRAEPIYVFRKR